MEGRIHARAVPLLSSALPPAPGWRSSDQADVAANWQDTPARRGGTTGRRQRSASALEDDRRSGRSWTTCRCPQPQVSKHLRVLSEVGLVTCRADGRRRLCRLEPARLRPFHEWLANYERAWNDRLDRVDDYLKELQQQGERHDT